MSEANITLSSPSISVAMSTSQTHTLNDGRGISEGIGGGNVYSQTLTVGSTANAVDRAWQLKTFTLPGASSIVIDVFDLGTRDIGAGAGRAGIGLPISFLEIVTFVIINTNTTGNGRLAIAPDATFGFTFIPTLNATGVDNSLGNRGLFVLHQPDEDAMGVIDGSRHRILLTALNDDVVLDFYMMGRHDVDVSSSSSSQSSSSSSSSASSSSSSQSSSSSSSSSSNSSSSSSSSQSSSSSSSS